MLPTPIRLDQQGINSKAPQAKSNLNNPFQAIFLWCRPRPHSFNFSQWLEVLEKFGIPKKQIASVFDFNSTRALLHNLKNSSDQLKAVFIICADLTCPELPKFIQELWEFSPNTFLLLAVSENFNLNHQPPITPFFKVVDISNVSSLPLETLSKTCLDPQLPPQTNPPQTLTEISNWLEKISTDIQKQKSFLINSEFFPSIPWFCNQLLDLLNDSNTGILLLDSERKVIQVNYQIVEFLGLPPADCCGKPIWDLFESSSLGAEFFARVQAENRTLSTFASPQKPLFGKSQFLAYAKPIFLADNKFGFLVFLRNRSFEAESRDRLHIQETILNQVNDAIFLFNLERIVTFWNPAAERLYRLPAENVLGKHLPQGIRSDTHAFSKAWQTCIEKGEWIGELRQIDAEGHHLTVLSRWSLLRGPDSEIKGILVANLDITEKNISRERELRAQRLESIGTMVGCIAHDMNNILQPISISLQLLAEKNFDEESHSILQTALNNLERAGKMIRQILTFARGVEGETEDIYVEDFLSDVEHFIRIAFPKNILLDCQWPQESKLLHGNPTQLYQAIINICINARDAMPNGGSLSIHVDVVPGNLLPTCPQNTQIAKEYIRIQIKDTGPGIPPEIRDKILEPFFTTKPAGKGTGLGLSTTNQIIRKHEGILYLDPSYTSGANFHIYLPVKNTSKSDFIHNRSSSDTPQSSSQSDLTLQLPLQKIQKPQADQTSPSPQHSSPLSSTPKKLSPHSTKSLTILLVDDEPAVLAVLKISLEKASHQILIAKNGYEALDLFRNHINQINLIITDVAMPEMSGLELISLIRQQAEKLNISPPPIIATTGMATPGQIESLQSLGVEKILSKPYGSKMLLDAIREVVESRDL